MELLRDDLVIEADGFGTVTIRRSKVDQEGAGAVAPVTTDAMRHLQVWIAAAGIETGPLFRGVLKGGRCRRQAGRGRCGARLQGDGRQGWADSGGNRTDQRSFNARRRGPGC